MRCRVGRLDGIGRESERVEIKGDSLRKSINFAYDTEDQQRTERVSPELVNGYRPEYVDHRNLDGIYTDVFGGCASARNLWRKSLMKYGLWPEIIIFK